MPTQRTSRRDWIIGTGSLMTAAGLPSSARPLDSVPDTFAEPTHSQTKPAAPADDADRLRRMKWWHEARFGMFIHWGLYSVIGRHEWVMENEGIPVSEYALLAKQFKPKPFPAREWAKIARRPACATWS